MSKMCDVLESWENARSESDVQLSRLHAEKIRLLVQLDQTLRLLGVNLLAANLYTEDLDEDVLLRLELCRTTMLRERWSLGSAQTTAWRVKGSFEEHSQR